jgi:hypothetical protein
MHAGRAAPVAARPLPQHGKTTASLTYNALGMAASSRPERARGAAPARRPGVAALLAGLTLFAGGCAGAPAIGARFPYESGQTVVVQGVVSDRAGQRLDDLDVVLEASRLGVGVYPPGQRKREIVTGSTKTDTDGEYALELDWNRRFNHFELVVGVPVATPQGEVMQELARVDITRRMGQGSPVAVPVTLEDTSFLSTLREFLGALRTADEQRVYRETGKPDRVDRIRYPDRQEAAWWYFRLGKVYRFRDGSLERVEDFTPVTPL